jgi:hypothetical protein
VTGAIAGVNALPARVATTEGLLTRAIHAWHGAAFAHAGSVAACLPDLPDGSSILALTADGGALLDLLLARNRTLRPLDPEAVLADDVAADAPRPDVVLLADVLHHVARGERERYLARIRERAAPEALFIVKEFAPGGLRSRLGWLTDRALSGDAVRFLTPPELRKLAARAFPELVAFWTPLYHVEPPNYCMLFHRLHLDRLTRSLGGV